MNVRIIRINKNIEKLYFIIIFIIIHDIVNLFIHQTDNEKINSIQAS